jgi:hypothetical protein
MGARHDSRDSPERFDPAEKALGVAVQTPAATGSRLPAWAVGGLVAAAALILTVLVTRLGPVPEIPTTRGGARLQVVAPSGGVDAVTEFRWNAPAGAESFRLEIADASRQFVYQTSVRGRRTFVLPAEARAQLQPGIEYRWKIDRLDARGETVESSTAASFSISK